MQEKTELKREAIPTLFHRVWAGGQIQTDDLKSIINLSRASRSSGFKTILWTDDEKHIQKEFDQMILNEGSGDIHASLKSLNVEVRNIHTLLEKLKTNPIFSSKETNDLIINILREAIGHRNLASVSDLIRYCVLYYEGGYYLDTDLRPIITSDTKFQADTPVLGFIGNFHPQLTAYQTFLKSMGLPYKKEYTMYGNNDVLGVIPQHPILRVAIKKILAAYTKLDLEPIFLKELSVGKIEKTNKLKLNLFEKEFINALSDEKNKVLKAKFINSILDISFNLRLLNNTKAQTPAQQDAINQKKVALIKSSEQLIQETSSALSLELKKYSVGTSTNIFTALFKRKEKQTVVTKANELILTYINLEIQQHQEQYGLGYEKATEMDAKRYPRAGTNDKYNKRLAHTVKASIYSVYDAITEFLYYNDKKDSSVFNAEEMKRFPSETFTASNFLENARTISVAASVDDWTVTTMAGCQIEMNCAGSWVKGQGKKVSFDDSVLPSRTKHSFFDVSVSKAAATNSLVDAAVTTGFTF